MKKSIITVFLIGLVLVFLSACGGKEEKTNAGISTAKEEQNTEKLDESTQEEKGSKLDQTGTDEAKSTPEQSENGSIVVYFSRVGNTDFPENIDASSSASIQVNDGVVKGNAQMIAEWVAEEAGCETLEVVAEDSYPVDYDETVEQARDEQSQKARPDLKTLARNVEGYDTLYLVFPNWWGDLPMPLYSFFDACDFSGKKINVFITHEGSSFSGTVDTIKELEPGAEVTEAIAVRGGSVSEEEQNVRQWVTDNK